LRIFYDVFHVAAEGDVIYSRTGKICDDFYVLGHPAVPVYLLDGPQPVVFDAGLTLMGDVYAAQIDKILGRRTPSLCCLTHVHFDHCGAVAAFKRRYPRMTVAASRKAGQILDRPHAVERICRLNRAADSLVTQIGVTRTRDAIFEPFTIDRFVEDGDCIEIGAGRRIEVIATPGHTWDCLSYRIPGPNILLSSEAAGQADQTGVIVTDCLADYGCYLASLRRLKAFSPDLLCPGHIFVYGAEDATAYLAKAQAACIDFFVLVSRLAQEEARDLHRIMHRIRAHEYDPNPGPKQPEPAYLINLAARVEAVLRAASTGAGPECAPGI
jgi:glyoxylase-like metal-dependent hydrolase (beta-lactamase superfamily II)